MPQTIRQNQLANGMNRDNRSPHVEGSAQVRMLGSRVTPRPASASATRSAPRGRELLEVAAATILVAVVPIAIVWSARASGRVTSPVTGVLLGMLISLGASSLGCLIWEAMPGSEDLLFSELLVWGYLHRSLTRRRVASAMAMVGPIRGSSTNAEELSTHERAELLEHLVSNIETRDPYLHGHSRRVARHAWMIARRMGLSREEVARIRTAAAIHDVGKVNTPTAVLHKAGRLTDTEYEIIKRHPGDGASMAEILRDPALAAMVRHHHERMDGTGYPDSLAGEAIPLGARIIAVADTFDAITSERPYRPASTHRCAIDVLTGEAGTRLDPAVVSAFCGHYAGRTPVAIWSLVAGLPERVISWLGGSAGGLASAAKVAAVAALVGGAAVTSSTLAIPAGAAAVQTSRAVASAGHHHRDTRRAPAGARRAQQRGSRRTLLASAPTPTPVSPSPSTPVSGGSAPARQPAVREAQTPSPAAGGSGGATPAPRREEAPRTASVAPAAGPGAAEGPARVPGPVSPGGSAGAGEGAHGSSGGESPAKTESSPSPGGGSETHPRSEEGHGSTEAHL